MLLTIIFHQSEYIASWLSHLCNPLISLSCDHFDVGHQLRVTMIEPVDVVAITFDVTHFDGDLVSLSNSLEMP